MTTKTELINALKVIADVCQSSECGKCRLQDFCDSYSTPASYYRRFVKENSDE